MNVHAQMSGQFSRQVNQVGSQMPGPSQHNGSSFHTQTQNFNGQRNSSVMDPNLIRIRDNVRWRIFQLLVRKRGQPDEVIIKKCQDIAKRLEEGLIKSARNMEEYANMNTLETRLHGLVKRAKPSNHAPQVSPFVNTPTPIVTMIPTPGLQDSVMVPTTVDLTMMTASTGASISASTPTTSSLRPTVNGSFSGMRGGFVRAAEGFLSNGYQQPPSSFSMNPSGDNMIVAERPISKMIPTPGFSESNNQMIINLESSDNSGAFPSDSSVVPQQIIQRQAGGQLLKNLGSQQHVQIGTLSGGFDGSGSSDSCSTTSSFGAASISQLRPHNPPHHPINNQNITQVRMSSTSRPSSLMSSQVNTQSSQSTSYMRPHVAEQTEKSKIQSLTSPRQNHLQSSMRPSQQRPHQMPQQQRFTEYNQPMQPSELSQTSVRNESFQSQLAFESSGHVKSKNEMEFQNEVFQPLISAGQIKYNSNGNLHTNPGLSFPSCGSQGMHSTPLQTSQTMMSDDCSNNFHGQPSGAQSDTLLHSRGHPNASSFTEKSFDEQHVHKEFQQRIVGHEEVQCINWSSEVPSNGLVVPPENGMDQPRVGGAANPLNAQRDEQFKNQLRWLLFLRHARGCRAPAGTCPERFCPVVQNLIKHMDTCKDISCSFRHCGPTKSVLTHQKSCRDLKCPVCVPYRKFLCVQKKIFTQKCLDGMQCSINRSLKSSETGEAKVKEIVRPAEPNFEFTETQPSVKRLKSEPPSQSLISENGIMTVRNVSSSPHELQSVQSSGNVNCDNHLQMKSEFPVVKAENSCNSDHDGTEIKNTTVDVALSQQLHDGSTLNNISSLPKEETVKLEKDNGQSMMEVVAQPKEQGSGIKSVKPKIKGVSLIELFTPEQVEEHITGLRQWVGQSKAKAEKNQAMEQRMTENCCQLCAVETLSFEPLTVYCSPCGGRIKRNAMYYTVVTGDSRHCFCVPCYNESRGDTIAVDGMAIAKGRMEKKKNDEETEEWWVQCDKCQAWQHQICALFNGRRNDGGQAEYSCPNCYMREVVRGERQPLPQSTVLGAKDLPGTALSDHIELRLARRLKQERLERARGLGKSYDEVPGVDGVVVRVVSSVDKKLEVKPLFLDIFREENYPLEFPYKSKVVLLFQKIEGVEVCLFGMYVQEFGSECLPPNQRRVYLSYLDSVKYFRPEVKTVSGEALRTFVYHEILIGYLDYCKKRGFASCYIWACPPLKGEDYILYCHPEIQKTPKSDKLREWYLAMLRKASKENIVVELTNLYDHFFVQTDECKAKVTAARLPYFDGDYWPGAAEDMLNQINQEEEGRKLNKKGPPKKLITKRALKASGHLDLSSNASKDVVLMHKLGESIAPMKEDFIMVHLQHSCTHCRMLMVSGNRWVCDRCKKFQLCDRCYDEEQKRDNQDRHPVNQKDKHGLKKIEITDVPDDTKDKDDILESEFFDTRQAFLSLCQGNHYQYDTLRSAKHSSMMVLYHLHNPTAPAFVTACHKCHLDIETGHGWRCETCPDFDVCNACYCKGVDHPHKLTNRPSIADPNAQNKEARQQRILSLRKTLDLLVHASQCRALHCQYTNCRKVKGLFRHGMQCKIRATGGCRLCKQMWHLLQLHARACKESACLVPRCRDLKQHMKRSQQQSDSRRRAAVMEMMRQRTREVAGFA